MLLKKTFHAFKKPSMLFQNLTKLYSHGVGPDDTSSTKTTGVKGHDHNSEALL